MTSEDEVAALAAALSATENITGWGDRAAAILALRVTPPVLDVERLARAIEAADAHEWDLGGAPKWAAAIAREYAALSDTTGTPRREWPDTTRTSNTESTVVVADPATLYRRCPDPTAHEVSDTTGTPEPLPAPAHAADCGWQTAGPGPYSRDHCTCDVYRTGTPEP